MIRARDDSPEHEPDDASQRPRKRQDVGNRDSSRHHEPGFIRSVECVNFMCHKNLKIEVGPGITFVSGQNGHGKSAILTALIQVFSTSAAMRAERGRLSDLRRTVRDKVKARSAKIVVRINNRRPAEELAVYAERSARQKPAYSLPPYQPDVFGDCIVVEKEIFEKSSKLRVLAGDGTLVSDKQSALLPIIGHFGYQFDNRLTVQTQENAKKRGDPRVLYDFFWNGSGFEGVNENLTGMRKALDEQNNYMVDVIQPRLASLEQEREELQRELDKLQRSRTLLEEKEKYHAMLLWQEFYAVERRFPSLLERVSKNNEKLLERKRKLAKRREGAAECEEELKNLPQGDETELKQQLQQTRTEISRVEARLQSYKQDVYLLKTSLKEIQSTIRGLEDSINELNAKKNQASSSHLRDKLNEEIQDLGTQVAAAQEKHRAYAKTLEEKRRVEEEARQKRESVSFRREARERDLMSIKQSIANLVMAKTTKNPIAHFGADCIELDKAITQNAHKFSSRPLGPFGQYIRFNNKPNDAQSKHINILLNGYMKAFLVTSPRDEQELRQLVSKMRGSRSISIFTVKPERFNLAEISPDKKYLTVMDCLDISQEPVRQCLVDWANINSIGLCNQASEAIDILRQNPRNLDTMISPHDSSSMYTIVSQQGRAVSNKKLTNQGLISRGAPVVTEERQAELEGQQSSVDAEVVQLKDRESQFKEEYNGARKALQEAETAQKRLRDNHDVLQRQLNGKTDERDSLPEDVSNDDTDREIQKKRVEIESLKSQLRDAETDLNESVTSKEDDEKTLKTMLSERQVLESRKTKMEEDLAEMKAKIDYYKGLVSEAETMVTKYEERQTELEESVAAEKQRLHTASERAKKVREKPVPLDDGVHAEDASSYINEKLNQINLHISSDEARHPRTYDIVLKEFTQKSDEQYEQEHLVTQQKADQIAQSNTLNNRNTVFNSVLRLSISRLKNEFAAALHAKGATATLEVDMTNRRLEVRDFQEASSSGGVKGRDVATVSGGEHSFVQSSLMSSMWSMVSTPLLCLDEYEVFMDDASRVTTQKRLISSILGRERKTQAILISPTVVKTGTGDDPMFKYVEVRDPAFNA